MPAYIQHISTCVPGHVYRQEELREEMIKRVAKTDLHKRIIHRIYSRSGIQTRHSILDDFREGGLRELYYNGYGSRPGTGARNRFYETRGRELFVDTARKALTEARGVSPEHITHLITISCTGFYSPGPDYDIIKNLGLEPDIERYHLGFMGCYAAIPGLKLASRICNLDPEANVMVIANELCTLHFQGGTSTDELISGSVFADGAAGTVVSASKPERGNFYRIGDFASTITTEGSEDMAWTIGDTGFNMVLSSYIPEILSRNLDGFLDSVLGRYNLTCRQVDRWAVHPGGRAILDRLEKQLDLSGAPLSYSRSVLSGYGNMSSVTVLFVLKEILDEDEPSPASKNVLAMAFGPGLTIESGLLVKHPQP